MIEPTGTAPTETRRQRPKRQALADFEYYGICQGQKEIGPLGYSPLPVNLVEAAFGQIQQLQTADPGVSLQNLNIDTCDNPTFVLGNPNANYLARDRTVPPGLRQGGRRSLRRGRDPERDRSDAGVLRLVSPAPRRSTGSGASTTATTAAAATAAAGASSTAQASRVGDEQGVGRPIPGVEASSRTDRLGLGAALALDAGRATGGAGPARDLGAAGRDRLPALAAQARNGRSHPVRRLVPLVLAVTALAGVVFPAVVRDRAGHRVGSLGHRPRDRHLDGDAPQGRRAGPTRSSTRGTSP